MDVFEEDEVMEEGNGAWNHGSGYVCLPECPEPVLRGLYSRVAGCQVASDEEKLVFSGSFDASSIPVP